uniref:Uncharacterized protein n=1 Tax=Setaria italica TaxID=4555 RepID=K3YCM2_SETIT
MDRSHHAEAGGTSNNTNINTGCDEVGGDDANDNDHVMMDDDYDCGDQNGDQRDVHVEPQVDEERHVDMEDMLRHIEPEVLLGSAKVLENFETLKKVVKDRMYVGCGKEWTMLCFILHLVILKAKFSCTYETKKIINPLKMRV